MKAFLTTMDTISEWTGKVLSVVIVIIILVMLFEIASRYLFNAPTIWAHEVSQHMFGAYSIVAGAYALLHFQHVRVDVIYTRFSPRLRALCDSITSPLFFLFVIPLLLYSWDKAWFSVMVMEVSISPFAPPMYPLRLTVLFGAILILLQGLAHFIRALHMAITGRELA